MSYLLVDILEGVFGEHRKHNDDTGQISFDCPACSEEKGLTNGDGKGNLEINYNRNLYKCWSCYETNNMHGPIMKLLKKYGNSRIIHDYLLVKPDADTAIGKEHADIIVELPEGYKRLSDCTDKDYKSNQAKQYLYDRGITDEIIDYYDIGYTYIGKYFNRIIIPSYDSDGILNYFIARWFAKEYTKLKYLNPLVEKQEIIFNELRINLDATIYLVEGATDHIVTPNSIPLLGKFISDVLLDLLQDYATGLIVIVLDDDAWEDAVNLYRKLDFGNLKDRIRIVKCPKDHDPSLIFQKLGNKGIVKLLKCARKLTEKELD
jgi:DNA primase